MIGMPKTKRNKIERSSISSFIKKFLILAGIVLGGGDLNKSLIVRP